MTWVPPAYRQPGQPWPPAGAPRRQHSRWWLPVIGGIGTAVAVAVAYYVTLLVAFLTSVCNDPPSVVASHQRSLRIWVIAVWLVAAGAPGLVAGIAKARHRATLPWVLAAAAMAGVGVAIAATTRPSTWCLF